jgi:hypothetical protein
LQPGLEALASDAHGVERPPAQTAALSTTQAARWFLSNSHRETVEHEWNSSRRCCARGQVEEVSTHDAKTYLQYAANCRRMASAMNVNDRKILLQRLTLRTKEQRRWNDLKRLVPAIERKVDKSCLVGAGNSATLVSQLQPSVTSGRGGFFMIDEQGFCTGPVN